MFYYLISRYNDQATEWNDMYKGELDRANFNLFIDGKKQSLHLNTTPSGENYPYRDTCSVKNDPVCIYGQPCYWKSVVPLQSANNLNMEVRIGENFIFNHSIPVVRKWELQRKEINCENSGQ